MMSNGIKQINRVIPHWFVLVTIVFSASCAERQLVKNEDWTGIEITGKITDTTGLPVPKAYLYAYNYGSSILGPAQAMSEPSDINGNYTIILPIGEYNLIARKRLSRSISGPLRNGDLHGRVSGLFSTGTGDTAGVDVIMRVFKQGMDGDPAKILSTQTRVSGVMTDKDGRPVSGAHAFAYQGKLRRDPPDFLSEKTGPDGRFSLSLPSSGEYTIGGRTGLRGRPRDNDMIGFWGGHDTQKFIGEGEIIENVELKLVPFSERTKK